MANSLFCFEDQQAYSDSIKSWQNQIDTLNARVERPDKETSEYLSKALVYGYFF